MAETDGIATAQDADQAQKRFVPLENNPEVFTALLRSLQIPPSLTLHDIYSFAPDDLLHIPRPAHALLFIVPSEVWQRSRDQDTTATSIEHYDSSGAQEPILWFPQTIGNACGLIAMLHALANGSARDHVPKTSPLSAIFEQAVDLKPAPRAKLLYDSAFLETAHGGAAQMGDTIAPGSDLSPGFHYTCFVKGDDGHLWELEGAWKGPIDRGFLKADEDVLSEPALQLGPQTFLKHVGGGAMDCWFSCVALSGQR